MSRGRQGSTPAPAEQTPPAEKVWCPTELSSLVHYTRNYQVPLVAYDYEMNCGWRYIPLPPTMDDRWVIWDESKDRHTGWIKAADLDLFDTSSGEVH